MSFGAGYVLSLLGSGVAFAAGPRWVPGSAYFTTAAPAVVWYTNSALYFTDPGDLSASVDHAAADALVAAAAAVWNVPTSLLVLGQGGELQEHVSGANVYVGSNGLVFPADVSSANYAAVQIAVRAREQPDPAVLPLCACCRRGADLGRNRHFGQTPSI